MYMHTYVFVCVYAYMYKPVEKFYSITAIKHFNG